LNTKAPTKLHKEQNGQEQFSIFFHQKKMKTNTYLQRKLPPAPKGGHKNAHLALGAGASTHFLNSF